MRTEEHKDYGKRPLAEDRKQPETVRLPCGGGDEVILNVSYLCENGTETHLERPFSEVRRQTRTPDQEKWCVLRQGADRSQSQGHNRVSKRFTKIHEYEQEMHKSHQKSCVRGGDSNNSRKIMRTS